MKAKILFILACVLLIISCARERSREEDHPAEDEYEIRRVYNRGPLQLTLNISETEISIAQSLSVFLEAIAPQDYQLEYPSISESFSDFSITDYLMPTPQLSENGILHHSRSYVLEPFLSGEYTILPIKITFKKEDESEPHELLTDEIEITVQSLLPEDMQELTIKDIYGPIAAFQSRRGWILYFGIPLAVLCGVFIFLILRRKKRKISATVMVPPDERALQRLRELLQNQLVEKGHVKIFYQELSDILRRYIEEKFGLHAPEQTTEEFLNDVRTHDALKKADQELLSQFLFHCDLVKFAEYAPSTREIEGTFNTCKEFIFSAEQGAEQRETQSKGLQEHAV